MNGQLLTFADTSAWFATVDPNDPNHGIARRFMSAKPRLVTTNFVIDETITLVLKRLDYTRALRLGEQLWGGQLARIIYITRADQQTAWQLFKRYSDKEFSFTDCTSFVVMERLGLTHAFAFDEHFSQTGQFVCIP
ncbi:MAG: PIN domain-containing protein [Anaerolineales bacterium]|nr:MAG: PIN domain-containing protein [Anaerolineales bacterium]